MFRKFEKIAIGGYRLYNRPKESCLYPLNCKFKSYTLLNPRGDPFSCIYCSVDSGFSDLHPEGHIATDIYLSGLLARCQNAWSQDGGNMRVIANGSTTDQY